MSTNGKVESKSVRSSHDKPYPHWCHASKKNHHRHAEVVSKLGVGAAGYGQSAGVRSVGVSDVQTQGSKTQLKLVCFALATGTGMSLYFGGSE